MKKKILVWGGKLLQGFIYDNKTEEISQNAHDCLSKVTKKYEIINYSMKDITALKVLGYLEKSIEIEEDITCSLLQLGDNEFFSLLEFSKINNSTLLLVIDKFIKEYEEILTVLESKNIIPIIMTLSVYNFKQLALTSNLSIENIERIYNLFNKSIIKLSSKNDRILINNYKILKKCDINEIIANDGISLNETAHNILGEALKRELNHSN